jgi:hypothetical protein
MKAKRETKATGETKATRKKTHFVPKVVFRTAFAGVVPVCVAAAGCGGATSDHTDRSEGGDGGPDAFLLGVGCPAFVCGVALQTFADASTDGAAKDAANDALVLSVACIAFDGGPCDFNPPPPDAAAVDGAAKDAAKDAFVFTVACIGFDGGPCGTLPPKDATAGDGTTPDGSIQDATADVPFLGVGISAFGDL